jgi:hypothetical protein
LVPYILVERVVYSDLSPWPPAADGTGSALRRFDMAAFGNDPVNWVAGMPFAGEPDTDNDGMPDAWEDAHGLNRNVNDADGDPDHDGMTNIQEYQAGTDPQDAQSNLRLVIVSLSPVTLRFNAAADKSYVVEYRNTLATGSWITLANVSAGAARTVSVNDPSSNSSRFYRVHSP